MSFHAHHVVIPMKWLKLQKQSWNVTFISSIATQNIQFQCTCVEGNRGSVMVKNHVIWINEVWTPSNVIKEKRTDDSCSSWPQQCEPQPALSDLNGSEKGRDLMNTPHKRAECKQGNLVPWSSVSCCFLYRLRTLLITPFQQNVFYSPYNKCNNCLHHDHHQYHDHINLTKCAEWLVTITASFGQRTFPYLQWPCS
jgi:hypothetical protein